MSVPPRTRADLPKPTPPPRTAHRTLPLEGLGRFAPPRDVSSIPPPIPPPRDSLVKSSSSLSLARSESANALSMVPRGAESSPSAHVLDPVGEDEDGVDESSAAYDTPELPSTPPPIQMSRPLRSGPPPRLTSKSQLNSGVPPPLPPTRPRADLVSVINPIQQKPRAEAASTNSAQQKSYVDRNILNPREDADSSWAGTWTTLVGTVDPFEVELGYRLQYREKIFKIQKMVIEKGFPESQRGDLWEMLCGGKAECSANLQHFYEDCLIHLEKTMTKAMHDIKKDVPRTMQNHPFFQSPQGMSCLSHVLNVFAFKSPHIGYCQSMNDIAAALVLIYEADERRAFWVLERLINMLIPTDYYTPGMIGARTDCEVFSQLVQQHHSKLFNHLAPALATRAIDLQIAVMPWFMCLFIKILPLDSVLRVWDFMFLEGGTCILLRFALALLQKHEAALLKLHDPGEIIPYLGKVGTDERDVTSILEAAVALSSSIPDKTIQKMRDSQRKALEKEYLAKISFSTPTRMISQVISPTALSGQKALLKTGESKTAQRTLKAVKNPRLALDRPKCEKCGEVSKFNEDMCCTSCGQKRKVKGVVHSGWLKKKSKQHKHIWQNRYVELWGSWLTYFHSVQDAANHRNPFSVQFTDILSVTIADQGAGANIGVRFNMTLNRDMGRDVLEWQAPTKEQCYEWVALLTAATQHQALQTEVDYSLMSSPEPRLARETVGPSPSGQFNNLSPIRPLQKMEAMTLLWRSIVGVAISPPSTPSVDQRLKENVIKGYDLVKQMGIPAEERANVWEIVSSARTQCVSNPKAYSQVVEQLGSLENKAISDIRKDVRRTMQNHPFFQVQSGMDALTRILSVFSVRHPHIGYCQSMNVLAGTLLVIYGLEHEERAYWLLDTLVNNFLPADYYTSAILGARVDCLVLSYLLQEYWPKLSAHLRAHNVDLQMVAMSWFMCLYTDTLDQANALRVWDLLLVSNNSTLLVRVALGILAKFENVLMTLNQTSEFFSLLGRVGQLVVDLMDILEVTQKVVREKRLEERIVKCRLGALATLTQKDVKK